MTLKGLDMAIGKTSAETSLAEGIVSSWIDPLFIPKIFDTMITDGYNLAERGLAAAGYAIGCGIIGDYILEDPSDPARYLPIFVNFSSFVGQKLFNRN
jgi:hypothetical protein